MPVLNSSHTLKFVTYVLLWYLVTDTGTFVSPSLLCDALAPSYSLTMLRCGFLRVLVFLSCLSSCVSSCFVYLCCFILSFCLSFVLSPSLSFVIGAFFFDHCFFLFFFLPDLVIFIFSSVHASCYICCLLFLWFSLLSLCSWCLYFPFVGSCLLACLLAGVLPSFLSKSAFLSWSFNLQVMGGMGTSVLTVLCVNCALDT